MPSLLFATLDVATLYAHFAAVLRMHENHPRKTYEGKAIEKTNSKAQNNLGRRS